MLPVLFQEVLNKQTILDRIDSVSRDIYVTFTEFQVIALRDLHGYPRGYKLDQTKKYAAYAAGKYFCKTKINWL